MKSFSLVVAVDEKNGIGKNGDLAWRLSPDLKHFKEITVKTEDSSRKNVVVMGRKTWDSLPVKFKPLPDRLNVVLSRNLQTHLRLPLEVLAFPDLEQALHNLSSRKEIEDIFVIGGAQIFSESICHSACQNLFVTELKGNFNCDVFFPTIPAWFQKTEESAWMAEDQIQYRFCRYRKSS